MKTRCVAMTSRTFLLFVLMITLVVISCMFALTSAHAALVSSSAEVYQLNLGTNNKLTMSPVGTAPIGTTCVEFDLNGMRATILSDRMKAVIPAGKARPRQIFAKCSEQVANRAPVIGGVPVSSILVGALYSFTPTISDADGDTPTFSIANKPSWITFSSATGKLYGTPSSGDVGSYSNIVVKASDGKASSTLPTFSITVNLPPTTSATPVYSCTDAGADGRILESATIEWPNCASASYKPASRSLVVATNDNGVLLWRLASKVTTGSVGAQINGEFKWVRPAEISWEQTPQAPTLFTAKLSWTPPTRNTDNSVLDNLAGYRILYGASPTALTQLVDVKIPSTSYIVENLTAGTWHFAVRAYNSNGVESENSNIASKNF